MDFDQYYMSMAVLAAMKSKDPSTQIGAVLVSPNNHIISTGYNDLPRGVDDRDQNRRKRPDKYQWTEHAERNAIYSAARHGVSTHNSIMYTHGIPCCDCGRAVIQAGISTVVYMPQGNIEGWSGSQLVTSRMFAEAGVSLRKYDGPLVGQLKLLISGEEQIL